jgi:hypothetical protein
VNLLAHTSETALFRDRSKRDHQQDAQNRPDRRESRHHNFWPPSICCLFEFHRINIALRKDPYDAANIGFRGSEFLCGIRRDRSGLLTSRCGPTRGSAIKRRGSQVLGKTILRAAAIGFPGRAGLSAINAGSAATGQGLLEKPITLVHFPGILLKKGQRGNRSIQDTAQMMRVATVRTIAG